MTPSHYHNYADLSEGSELLNVCQVYAAECVSKIKTIISIIFYSIYGAVCLQFTQLFCFDHLNVYFILLSWNNGLSRNIGMRCMSYMFLLQNVRTNEQFWRCQKSR